MSVLRKADLAMQKCEHDLRELGIEALRAGEYDVARRLTELAEAMADRRARAGLADEPGGTVRPAERKGVHNSAVASPPARRKPSAEYPRFLRKGDHLVKVGWSKKVGAEYEHKAPRVAVLAFARHLRTRTRPGRIWKVEDLTPVSDGQGEMPSYQVYLMVGWLRATGLIEKRGRDGYVIGPDGLTDEALERRLSALASQGL
jgi:hypothetical protein